MAKYDPGNTDYTRRTHVVRIDMDGGDVPPDGPSTATNYIDVEVLDAIAFRIEDNKEVILDFSRDKPEPYIVDETGGRHGRKPDNSEATRRSHMKRVANKDGSAMIDVEVLDVVAFRDFNGQEWIINMPSDDDENPVDIFNSTTDTGDTSATRRAHNEKISADLTDKDPTDYLTVVRNDAISLRTIMGREVILNIPSNNDPLSSDKAASTYVWSPKDYDPTNEDGPIPPPNRDLNVYVAPVKDVSNYLTGDEEIMQGPFWWIRKISGGGAWILISVKATNSVVGSTSPPSTPIITLKLDGEPGDTRPKPVLIEKSAPLVTHTTNPGVEQTLYFVWNDAVPFPDLANYNNTVYVNPPFDFTYSEQFSKVINTGASSGPPTQPNFDFGITPSGSGYFPDMATATAYASDFNTFYTPGLQIFSTIWRADGTEIGYPGDSGPRVIVYPALLDLPAVFSSATTSVVQQFLLKIPSAEAESDLIVTILTGEGHNVSTVHVDGFSDQTAPLVHIADIATPGGDGGVSGDPTNPDIDVPDANNIVSTKYVITTKLVPGLPEIDGDTKAHHTQIVITGGATTPPGGGGRSV